jgi:hypothetical protein
MKKISYIFLLLAYLIFVFYLTLPDPDFPPPPNDAVQSGEPADTEDPLRRAYFTDFSREEVLNHYQTEFNKPLAVYFPQLTYRLNYPPEESRTIIRDQTRSTYLEEIVHPFRESLFINGYEPSEEQHIINIGGKIWKQKIVVKYIPSSVYFRVSIASVAVILLIVLVKEWKSALGKLYSTVIAVRNIKNKTKKNNLHR